MKRVWLFLLAVGLGGVVEVRGQQPIDQAAEEAAIRKASAAYAEAFNNRDTKALAELWSPEAVYVNRSTGEQVTGRARIAEQFAVLFREEPELKLEVKV